MNKTIFQNRFFGEYQLTIILAVTIFLISCPTHSQDGSIPDFTMPDWIEEIGAKMEPFPEKTFHVADFGAVNDGETSSTKAIQTCSLMKESPCWAHMMKRNFQRH
jgi:hypothetical protein